jgi:hypothetical protein
MATQVRVELLRRERSLRRITFANPRLDPADHLLTGTPRPWHQGVRELPERGHLVRAVYYNPTGTVERTLVIDPGDSALAMFRARYGRVAPPIE